MTTLLSIPARPFAFALPPGRAAIVKRCHPSRRTATPKRASRFSVIST